MAKVVLSGHILVSAEDLKAVREALPVHRDLTRAEPGCLIFRVDEDPNQTGKFNVYEEFDGADSFQKHQQRVAESAWGKVSQNVERFYQINEVED